VGVVVKAMQSGERLERGEAAVDVAARLRGMWA
jgi:hypothetical protein